MAKLLVIESSPRSASISSKLAQRFAQEWKQKNPDGQVTLHNVALEPPPPLTDASIAAFHTPQDALTPTQKDVIATSEKFVQELIEADTVVLGAPMWNFGISAPLKAWIDQIVRAGKTFTYTAQGPKGLVDPAKPVIVIAARGGAYSGDSPVGFLDQQEPYLRTVLGFIGLTNITFVYAENLARGEESAALGIKNGEAALLQLV